MSLRASILVAGDDQTSARYLKRLLTREGHDVAVVHAGGDILDACQCAPPDLVLLDLAAPGGDAFDLCRSLKHAAATRFVPVVIITAEGDRRDRLKGIEAGCDDFLTKPFDPTELRARIRSLVRLKRFTDELESAEAVILGLGATIEARDPTTNGHCQRLAAYATGLGRALGLDDEDIAALERGGFLHDIGKIAVPDRVLLKDGALDAHETRVMRKHPVVGDSLCAGLRSLTKVRPIVRHHHERLDGSGYPDGLRNAQVPLLAQIISTVDVFDALTTDRPYRDAVERSDAFQMLMDEAGKGWRDRALVELLVRIVDNRPKP